MFKNLSLSSLFLFITAFSIFTLPPLDPDFGWHLRCGNLLFNSSSCVQNSFTYYLANYQWAYSAFIYDFFLALIFNNIGFWGLSLMGATVLTAIVYVAFKSMSGSLILKIILISSATVLSWETINLGLRPQLFSLLFLLITHYILARNLDHPAKSLFLLPVLFLIWANTHAGFFLGPMLMLFYLMHLIYKCLGNNFVLKNLLIPVISFITGLGATLLNPFGYKIYTELLRHFDIPLNTLIAEWTAPPEWQVLLIILLTAGYSISVVNKARQIPKASRLYNILLIIFVAYLGFSARRNLPIFYFVYVILASDLFRAYSLKSFKEISWLIMFAIFLFIGLNNVYRTVRLNIDHQLFCTVRNVPCKATEFLKSELINRKDESIHIYNTYEWGGYFNWQVPQAKYFIDGRMPAWEDPVSGKSAYTEWLEILQTRPGWDETLNELETDYIFIGVGTFMDLLLMEDAEKYGYEEIYRDDKATIFVKT